MLIKISEKSKESIYKALILILCLLLLLDLYPAFHKYLDFLSPAFVLLVGLLFSLFCGKVYANINSQISKKLLQYSIIGLGFGINLNESLKSGLSGMSFTIISVFATLILGIILGNYIFKINRNITFLISSGTAICGGSAIAAISPIINAKDEENSIALAIVFILNSIALFIFPILGRLLNLTPEQFGEWVAIAIHDTSSVVGAASEYGDKALEIATMIKLTRALWIIPLAIITSFIFSSNSKKIKIPWFILGFIFAMLFSTYYLGLSSQFSYWVAMISKKGLTITMFFIGASLSFEAIKKIGIYPLIMAVLLWFLVSFISIIFILYLG